MSKYIFISALLLSFHFQAIAQQVLDLNQSQQLMTMDEGVEFMNQGDFEKAEELFRDVLLNVEVVPADLCFYFGKNSYHLNKMTQSIDWLNKYIELKGTSGRFFDAAVEYLKLAEEEQQTLQNTASKTQTNKKSPKKEFINCEQTPFVVCPVCSGEGVIIERGSLGTSVYKTCPYCKETGKMSCEDYKKYVTGKYSLEGEN